MSRVATLEIPEKGDDHAVDAWRYTEPVGSEAAEDAVFPEAEWKRKP